MVRQLLGHNYPTAWVKKTHQLMGQNDTPPGDKKPPEMGGLGCAPIGA